MRTDRRLTVSWRVQEGELCLARDRLARGMVCLAVGVYLARWLVGQTPPPPPEAHYPPGRQTRRQIPPPPPRIQTKRQTSLPWTEWTTHACENSTFRHTSYTVGNKRMQDLKER